MKRLIPFLLALSFVFPAKAQLSNLLDWSDTSVAYYGVLSGKYLYVIKDTFGVNSPSYFKILTKSFQVRSLNYQNANAGTPQNILWANDSGVLQKSPISSIVPVPTFTIPSRSLSTTGSNNTFTISPTRAAIVHYTIDFSAALTLTTSSGNVSLDYSLDGGTTWVNVDRVTQTFGVSVTITTSQSLHLGGVIPANALVRIYRISNSNVTITIPTGTSNTYQQEVLL